MGKFLNIDELDESSLIKKSYFFITKLPSLLVKTSIFICITFSGVFINIFFGYGYLSAYSKSIDFKVFAFGNDIKFGLLSTIVGVTLSILYFYYSSTKNRKFLFLLLIFELILSAGLSIILLGLFYEATPFNQEVLNHGVYIALVLIVLFSLVFNYDSETAREAKLQVQANESKQTKNGQIGDKEVVV